jgi:hypothetical protein
MRVAPAHCEKVCRLQRWPWRDRGKGVSVKKWQQIRGRGAPRAPRGRPQAEHRLEHGPIGPLAHASSPHVVTRGLRCDHSEPDPEVSRECCCAVGARVVRRRCESACVLMREGPGSSPEPSARACPHHACSHDDGRRAARSRPRPASTGTALSAPGELDGVVAEVHRNLSPQAATINRHRRGASRSSRRSLGVSLAWRLPARRESPPIPRHAPRP